MEPKLYNLEQIELMAEGNKEFVMTMVNMFIELTPDLINKIKKGLVDNNYDEIKSQAHKLKPSIDMMGIVSAKNEIREIEKLALERADVYTLNNKITYLETTLNKVLEQLKSL
ncbi:MAG: Hpt domain-containing protein [Bacteroidetes bacterium]|nr:Hpt domain-containing protein [Bacteroidota bacterium]